MLRKGLKPVIPPLLVLSAMFVAFLMVQSRPVLPRSDATAPLPRVQLLRVQKGEVPVTIHAQGTVTARRQLDLAADVAGRVEWIAPEFVEGARVAEGTLLAKVDAIDYRVILADARVALASAEMALADATALKRRAAMTEADARVQASRERIRQAEQNLAHTGIRAPFNALVDTRLAELGQYLSPGKGVARLLGTDLAEIRLPVSAADAGFLDMQSAEPVWIEAQMGAAQLRWAGRLARVEQRVDTQTRVIPVIVEVDFPYDTDRHGTALPLGLFVETALPGKPLHDAIALPRSALHGGDSVFVLADGFLRRRSVHVARLDEEQVIVSDGLDDGDAVALTRLELMFDGMPAAAIDG
jgi:RND family efflux transporter MFP subunit